MHASKQLRPPEGGRRSRRSVGSLSAFDKYSTNITPAARTRTPVRNVSDDPQEFALGPRTGRSQPLTSSASKSSRATAWSVPSQSRPSMVVPLRPYSLARCQWPCIAGFAMLDSGRALREDAHSCQASGAICWGSYPGRVHPRLLGVRLLNLEFNHVGRPHETNDIPSSPPTANYLPLSCHLLDQATRPHRIRMPTTPTDGCGARNWSVW